MIDIERMRFLINRIPAAVFRVEKAIARATRVSPTLSDMPHGTSGTDRVAAGVQDIMIAKETLHSLRKELQELRDELEPMIDALDSPLQRTAMKLRYMDGVSVRRIAYRLNYSEQHMFRVISAAESKIKQMQM